MTSIEQIARGSPLSGDERRQLMRVLPPKLDGAGVWLVIPCYKVKAHILNVIRKAPPCVEGSAPCDSSCRAGSPA